MRKVALSCLLVLFLAVSLIPAGEVNAQERDPSATETQAINNAIQMLKDLGLGSMADNVQSYLDEGLIKVDPDLGTDGLTSRDPFGSETITLNQRLFLGYGAGGWIKFDTVVSIAATLVHEKHHAEEQSLLGNVILYLGQSIVGIFTDAPDVVEYGAYNQEFAFLNRVLKKLLGDWNDALAEWNKEMREYNAKVDRYNSMERPTKELVNEMLREIGELLKKVDKMQEILDKLTALYNKYNSLAEGYRVAVGDEDAADGVRGIATEEHAKNNARKEELASNKQKMLAHKELLEALDPPLERLDLFQPDPLTSVADADSFLVTLSSKVNENEKIYAYYRSKATGSEKFGLAKLYFEEIAGKIADGRANLHLFMTEHQGYIFPSPVIFGILVQDGSIKEVRETPYDFPDYEAYIPEESVIAAFANGNVAASLDSQLESGVVRIQVVVDSADVPAPRDKVEDTTPPEVVTTSPAAGASDVSIDTVVKVIFSEAMDSDHITDDSFELSGGVGGTVSYDIVTKTATFVPDANLEYGTVYTAILSSTITDAAGNPLMETSWNFTTEQLPPAKPFNWSALWGIIAGVAVLGALIFFLVRRKAY